MPTGPDRARRKRNRWQIAGILLRNLGEAMERLTAQQSASLRQAAAKIGPRPPEAEPIVPTKPPSVPPAEKRRLARCVEREALYDRIVSFANKAGRFLPL